MRCFFFINAILWTKRAISMSLGQATLGRRCSVLSKSIPKPKNLQRITRSNPLTYIHGNPEQSEIYLCDSYMSNHFACMEPLWGWGGGTVAYLNGKKH